MTTAAATAESPLIYALNLGWRIAYLYALSDDFDKPVGDTLLPLHDSLAPEDQLELQVRAAAGDARRARIDDCAEALDELSKDAPAAAGSPERSHEFRRRLRATHIAIDKELWARREADGKAYELGSGLSDTYNRICRAYRYGDAAAAQAWEEVFHEKRIERLKALLHDLESRLDSQGVAVVSDHLDSWCRRVADRAGAPPPSKDDTRKFLRRQTTTWRQLLARDKEPEAYLDPEQRAKVPTTLARMIRKRFGRWRLAALFVATGLLLAAINAETITGWFDKHSVTGWLLTGGASVAGALGITQASVGLTIRTRVTDWTELLWSRALAQQVTGATLLVDELLPPPPTRKVTNAGHLAAEKAGALRNRRAAERSGAPAGVGREERLAV